MNKERVKQLLTEALDENEELFLMAEKQIKKIEKENINIDKYKALLKLYDQADIINDIV